MINYDLTKIRALAFDVDGVLSDPNILLIGGEFVRTANTKDGYALQLAAKCDLKLAIITGGKGDPIKHRYESLGFQDVFMNCKQKIETLEMWMEKYALKPDEVLYMGDDIPDFEPIRRVGCSCCPADAAAEIREIVTYISPREGGRGCVRDVVEQVLKAQGFWMADRDAFGW